MLNVVLPCICCFEYAVLLLVCLCAAQVQVYMDRLRQQRLERITGRQDDEIVSIVKLYLVVTAVIIGIAVITSLPY
jgi:hypothetical protein